jgi:serine/threonine-protein kinase
MQPVQYEPGHVLAGTVYRVIRHLATGGMGSVYDVEDTTVEKRYVLKTLHPQLVSREDLARRMRDEAKSLAKLQHPNIVDVITAGITTDAVKMPFYVMERLVGQNLRVVLEKRSALDVTHCYRIAIDVADALEHAHENNIVHRDVKPENIFLHRNANGTTTTKLLDFGIMRLLDRKASHTHGKFVGTLRYASPEQVSGGDIGPATDMYSLGLVLYEMLSGRGPFDDVGDQYAIGAAHVAMAPPPPSRFVQVAPDVERLVMSALAKDPAQRPRDCFAFASELRRILREEEKRPRSDTAVNVLSAPPPQARAPGAKVPTDLETGPTIPGARPPSGAASGAAPPPTRKEGAVSPIAPTLEAAEMPPAHAPNVQVVTPAHGGRKIDRNAPTRVSGPDGSTQRVPRNDTEVEAEPNEDALRAAFGEPAPLVVPREGSSPSVDLAFPPMQFPSATGPTAGEASTRPPERGPIMLVVGAAVIAVMLVLGAFVAVKKPWQGAAPSAAAPPSAGAGAGAATSPPAAGGAPAASVAAVASGAEPVASGAEPVASAVSASASPANPPAPAATAAAVARPGVPAARAPLPASAPKQPGPTASGYSPAVKFE